MDNVPVPEPKELVEVPRSEGTAVIDPTRLSVANPSRKFQIKIWDWIRNVAILGLVLLTINGFYVTFHRVTVIEVLNEPISIASNQPIKPGNDINVEIKYCKHINQTATVTPMLIGQGVPNKFLPSFKSDVSVGCRQDIATVGTIPLSAQQGTYVLRLVFDYQASVLHQESVTVESEPFEVGPGKVLYLD